MARQPGQIDLRKREQILDAAAQAFGARGVEVSVEEIARLAGVSKQTVYNQFGCKSDLLRATVTRRRADLLEPLDVSHDEEPLDDRLSRYGAVFLGLYLRPATQMLIRSAIVAAPAQPDIARTFYAEGPFSSRERLSGFLAREMAAGRLGQADPLRAADMLTGMLLGHLTLRFLLGIEPEFDEGAVAMRARECARRFIAAFAP